MNESDTRTYYSRRAREEHLLAADARHPAAAHAHAAMAAAYAALSSADTTNVPEGDRCEPSA